MNNKDLGRPLTRQPALVASPSSPSVSTKGFDQAQGSEAGSENPDFYEYLRRFTEMGKAVHTAANKLREMKAETEVRARMESALARIAAEVRDARWSTHWRCGLGQAHAIMREALDGPASVDTHPEGGDAQQAPALLSGAVGVAETPAISGGTHAK